MKIWIWVAIVVVVLVAAYFLLVGTSSTPAPVEQAAETVDNANVTATVENVVAGEGETESPAPVEKSN